MTTRRPIVYLGVALASCFAAANLYAATDAAGSVTYLSGTLSVKKPDGSVKILSQKSAVEPGDTLATERDSYAQLNFTDGSGMTMRPNTRMTIQSYKFVKEEPKEDSVFFRLLKGGLRTITGLIGKRGNENAYKIGTTTATIGIRGSSGETLECPCEGTTDKSKDLAPGTYHATLTGAYIMANEQGDIVIKPDEYGYTPDRNKPPVILPGDPGLGLDQLPFTLGAGSGGGECSVQ